MAEMNEQTGGKTLLYQRIVDAIMEQIRSGSFSYDEPICTESGLMDQYGVSRITVRRALSELESKGILIRKRGVGSFVSRDVYQQSSYPQTPAFPVGSASASAGGSPLFAFVLPFNISVTGLRGTYQAASAYLAERDCMTSIYISEDSGENRARFILGRLAQLNIAGVAYYPYTNHIHQELIDRLLLDGKPVVLMDLPSPCRHLASVTSDNFNGTLALMRYLISQGHRRIAFLTGITPKDRPTISDRYSGYLLAHTEAGLPLDHDLICMSMTHEARQLPAEDPGSLQQEVKRLYQLGATAIVTEHDGFAYQVLQACRELGIRVPDQLSVCGFDRSEWVTMHAGMTITTVAQDYPAIGRAVGEMLYQGLSTPLQAHEPRIIPMTLSVGNTSGPVPKK